MHGTMWEDAKYITFVITAILYYTGNLEMVARRILEGESEVISEINFPDFTHLTQTFLIWGSILAFTALLVTVALLITYIYISNACFFNVIRVFCRLIYASVRLAFCMLQFLLAAPFRCLLMNHQLRKKKPEEKNL